MNLALAIAIYVLCWWLVLFTILPIGVRTQQEEGEISPGTAESAPSRPMLARKLIATTVVASLLFALVYAVIVHRIVDLEDVPFLPRFEPAAVPR